MKLILASSSKYRKNLLSKLQMPFESISPEIDEQISHDLGILENAQYLSKQKALKVSESYPNALIIGSDQICSLNEEILHKPGDNANAFNQLKSCSNKEVFFYTGICLLNSQNNKSLIDCDVTKVKFRNLTDSEIHEYLNKDQPYDCAGSFKVESLGISLFQSIESTDPKALIGLPMIKLNNMMRKFGMNPLGENIG